MANVRQHPKFIYSDLIKDYVAARAQDAAIIEIYLVHELQKKFVENNVQYYPRLGCWDGEHVDIIKQNIDSYSKIILKEISILTPNNMNQWMVKKADLSNFINTNVKYVNRDRILKQLENLSTWANLKFINEEKMSFIELENICSEYFIKHRKEDPEHFNFPLDDLRKDFYKFMELLHKRRQSCYAYFMNCLFATMQNLWSPNPIKRVILAVGKNQSGKTSLLLWASNLPKIIRAKNFQSSLISGIQFEWNSGKVFPPNCPFVYCPEIRIIESEGYPKDKMCSDFMNMMKSAVRQGELISTRNPKEEAQEYESKSLVVFNANSDADVDEVYYISQAYFAPFKVWDRVKFVKVDILDMIPGSKIPRFPDLFKLFWKILDAQKNDAALKKHFPYVVLSYYADCLKTLEYNDLTPNASVDFSLFTNLIPYLNKNIFDSMVGFQDTFKMNEYLKEKSKEERIIEELFMIFDEEFPKKLENVPGEVMNSIAKNVKERIGTFHKDRTKKDLGKTFTGPRLPMIKVTAGYALPCIHNSQVKRIFDDDTRWSCKKYEKFYKKDDKQGTESISSTTFYLHKWREDKEKKEAEIKRKLLESQKKD